jgi:hypothetical protein
VVYIVVSSPPAIEDIESMGREIEPRRGLVRMVPFRKRGFGLNYTSERSLGEKVTEK